MTSRRANCAACGKFDKTCFKDPAKAGLEPGWCWASYALDKNGDPRPCSDLTKDVQESGDKDKCNDHVGPLNIVCKYQDETNQCVTAKEYKAMDGSDEPTWKNQGTWAAKDGIYDCRACAYDGNGHPKVPASDPTKPTPRPSKPTPNPTPRTPQPTPASPTPGAGPTPASDSSTDSTESGFRELGLLGALALLQQVRAPVCNVLNNLDEEKAAQGSSLSEENPALELISDALKCGRMRSGIIPSPTPGTDDSV